MNFDAIVADANVLLSAVIGKAALRVITDSNLTIHVSVFNADEVEEYLPSMAKKYKLPLDLVELQWKVLPLTRHDDKKYRRHFKKAQLELANRDPEDAHALALARALKFPLWSNDNDLQGFEIPCYTTAQLLSIIDRRDKH